MTDVKYDIVVDTELAEEVRIIETMRSLMEISAAGAYTCLRGPRSSGALLFAAGEYQIPGHVAPIPGLPTCVDEETCMMENGHCVRNIHAEVDALLKAAEAGIPTYAGTMLTINKPCYNCMMACAKAGIKIIIYAFAVYDEDRTNAVAEAAGMKVLRVQI